MNAQNIAIFNISHILENLQVYKDFTHQLNEFQKKKFEELKKEEELLINEKKDIEESKILLSESEYLNRISIFNDKKNNFENKVNKLNNYLSTNIEINENKILNEIINIVQKIAMKNDIDIVFSDEQYFLATETINISDQIYKDLNNLEILLELSEYE